MVYPWVIIACAYTLLGQSSCLFLCYIYTFLYILFTCIYIHSFYMYPLLITVLYMYTRHWSSSDRLTVRSTKTATVNRVGRVSHGVESHGAHQGLLGGCSVLSKVHQLLVKGNFGTLKYSYTLG